jgi:HSP20 family protein
MTTLPVQRRRALFPEIADLLAGFPSWGSLRPFDGNVMRLEDELKDGSYELRSGIDPAKDVDITVRDGQLTIKAERTEKKESNGRSEFAYGSFVRSVSLPPGSNEDDIKASYDKGILTVSVPVADTKPVEKHVAIESGR